MRYLVRARVIPGQESDLIRAIEDETLGQGSVADGEYLRNMNDARLCADQTVCWVEICYCPKPLQEERPYWEKYFDLTKVQDAHDRRKCRDESGSQPWACDDCDCTARLDQKLKNTGESFLQCLKGADHSSKNIRTDPEIEPTTSRALPHSLQPDSPRRTECVRSAQQRFAEYVDANAQAVYRVRIGASASGRGASSGQVRL
jgi:hypothetical protein